MTREAVIVHHPVPDEVHRLLTDAGYLPARYTAAVTEYRHHRSDGRPASPPADSINADRLLYTPEQAAQMLGVGRTTVYNLLRRRVLPSVQVGRSRRITRRRLAEYVDSLDAGRPSHPAVKMVIEEIAATPPRSSPGSIRCSALAADHGNHRMEGST